MSNHSLTVCRRAWFRQATIGMRAYTIALRLLDEKSCSGVDFRGCTKQELEDEYATEGGNLRHLTITELRAILAQEKS